jgi:hypothetical protein
MAGHQPVAHERVPQVPPLAINSHEFALPPEVLDTKPDVAIDRKMPTDAVNPERFTGQQKMELNALDLINSIHGPGVNN